MKDADSLSARTGAANELSTFDFSAYKYAELGVDAPSEVRHNEANLPSRSVYWARPLAAGRIRRG